MVNTAEHSEEEKRKQTTVWLRFDNHVANRVETKA